MREITKLMIKDFSLMKCGYDFMGFKIDKKQSLSFHHLIIPRRNCKDFGLGDGYYYWNGAILTQLNMAHEYLHVIEAKDPEIFYLISSEMIDENIKGRLDLENIKRINDLLLYFEKEHCGERTKKGKVLIKESYIKGRIL